MPAVTRGDSLEKKWREIISDLQESSLSIAAYAKSHDISEGSLYNWSKRLGVPLRKSPLSFIEVEPLSAAQSPSKEEYFSVDVVVAKGGCVKVDMSWPKVIEFVKALL
jgi:hypothetical protein